MNFGTEPYFSPVKNQIVSVGNLCVLIHPPATRLQYLKESCSCIDIGLWSHNARPNGIAARRDSGNLIFKPIYFRSGLIRCGALQLALIVGELTILKFNLAILARNDVAIGPLKSE